MSERRSRVNVCSNQSMPRARWPRSRPTRPRWSNTKPAVWLSLRRGRICIPATRSTRPGCPAGSGRCCSVGTAPQTSPSFAAADLGPVLGLTAGSAARLIADGLDLRHRLPRCWAAAQPGHVAVFHVRRVACTDPQAHPGAGRGGGRPDRPQAGRGAVRAAGRPAGGLRLRRRPRRCGCGGRAGRPGPVRPVGPHQRARLPGDRGQDRRRRRRLGLRVDHPAGRDPAPRRRPRQPRRPPLESVRDVDQPTRRGPCPPQRPPRRRPRPAGRGASRRGEPRPDGRAARGGGRGFTL